MKFEEAIYQLRQGKKVCIHNSSFLTDTDYIYIDEDNNLRLRLSNGVEGSFKLSSFDINSDKWEIYIVNEGNSI